MSVQQVKEDLELIASLTASTAGFLKNNVNGMMVGDGKFIKAEMKPQEVIEKAKNTLISEFKNNSDAQPIPATPIQRVDFAQPPTPVQTVIRPGTIQPVLHTGTVTPQIDNKSENPDQLLFNFDNTPTAQNIYYKLNHIVERIDKLSQRVNDLSEHIVKKKLDKKKEKV